MLWRNIGWLFFPATAFLWSCARACEAPAGTNFSDHPGYWCSLDARISVSTGCGVAVQEVIKVPWTTGILDRSVPTEDNQRIEDVSAYRLLNGIRTGNLSATQRRERPNNRLLSIQVGQVREPVSVLITYMKIGGVQTFSRCSSDRFKPAHNSEDNTVMLSDWAIGGRSVSDVQHVAVTFNLQHDGKLEYIDTQTTVLERFSLETKNNANTASGQLSVSYNGSTAGLSPSQLIFYIRYSMPFGAQSCPVSRNCNYESMILNEGQSSEFKNRIIIISVSLTVALIVVGGSVVALVLYCRRVKEGQQDSNIDQEDLPESLRHFEYDTGDDQMGEKRAEQEWMSDKNTEMKEEFYALDLSPRNRGKKGGEGF